MKSLLDFNEDDVINLTRDPANISSDHRRVAIISSGHHSDKLVLELQKREVDVTDLFLSEGDFYTGFVTSFSNQKELYRLMGDSEAGFFITAFYDDRIGKRIIDRYDGWLWNVHASLLPDFKGPDPVTAMIEAGLQNGAVTVHLIAEGIDSGPVLGQRRFQFRFKSPDTIYKRDVAPHAAALLADILNQPRISPAPQSELLGRSTLEYQR